MSIYLILLILLILIAATLAWTFIWLIGMAFLMSHFEQVSTPLAYALLFMGGPAIWVLYLAVHLIANSEED